MPYEWSLTLPTNGNPVFLKAFHDSIDVLQRIVLSELAAEIWGESAHDVISTTFSDPDSSASDRLRIAISRPSDGKEIAVYNFTDDGGTRRTFNGSIPGPGTRMDWESLAESVMCDVIDVLERPLRALADFARIGAQIQEILHRIEEARLPEHQNTPPPRYIFRPPPRRGRKPDRARRLIAS